MLKQLPKILLQFKKSWLHSITNLNCSDFSETIFNSSFPKSSQNFNQLSISSTAGSTELALSINMEIPVIISFLPKATTTKRIYRLESTISCPTGTKITTGQDITLQTPISKKSAKISLVLLISSEKFPSKLHNINNRITISWTKTTNFWPLCNIMTESQPLPKDI